MKITIFYFSGTGNTWYGANALADALKAKGAEAEAVSIEKFKDGDTEQIKRLIDASDKIVVGYPIYGSLAPMNMRAFLDNLPETQDGKSVSVFTTMALYSGDGAIAYRKLLRSKGYVFETGMEFIMPNNINIPGFPDVLKVGDQAKIDRRKQKADVKINKMADALLSGKSIVSYDRIFGHMNGAIQRKYVDGFIRKMNSTMYTERSRCTKCMQCVKMCPVGNITFSDGKIQIGDGCIACMRCYHFCPTNAINITEKSLDTERWLRYRGPTKGYVKTLL